MEPGSSLEWSCNELKSTESMAFASSILKVVSSSLPSFCNRTSRSSTEGHPSKSFTSKRNYLLVTRRMVCIIAMQLLQNAESSYFNSSDLLMTADEAHNIISPLHVPPRP